MPGRTPGSGAALRPGATEEAAAAPGWVEPELERIARDLPLPGLEAARAAYLGCLAGCRGAVDLSAGHDRCRAALLKAAEGAGIDRETCRALELRLEALEAEIETRI